MKKKFAVIGVGNMAKSIIAGITSSNIQVSAFYLFDKFSPACDCYKEKEVSKEAISHIEHLFASDCNFFYFTGKKNAEVEHYLEQQIFGSTVFFDVVSK